MPADHEEKLHGYTPINKKETCTYSYRIQGPGSSEFGDKSSPTPNPFILRRGSMVSLNFFTVHTSNE